MNLAVLGRCGLYVRHDGVVRVSSTSEGLQGSFDSKKESRYERYGEQKKEKRNEEDNHEGQLLPFMLLRRA
jgi:hypothetical protein